MQPGQPFFPPAPPQGLQGHRGQRAEARADQGGNQDIKRPVRTHVNAAVGNQQRRQKNQPAPPAEKNRRDRRHGKIVGRVARGKRVAADGLDAGLGVLDPQRFRQGQNPWLGLGQVHDSHALERIVRTRPAHGFFDRIDHQPVGDAHRNPGREQKHPPAESPENRRHDHAQQKKRPPEVEARDQGHHPVHGGVGPRVIDEKKKLLIHAIRRIPCRMIFRSARFRKPHALVALILFPLLGHAEPDAAAILEAARVNPLGQKITLNAQLRSGSRVTPFQIIVDGRVRYVFEKPDQELILELQDDASVLTERLGGKTAPVRPARYDDSVRGSGLTYEDLSLKFLYWKNPALIGEETIRLLPAWKIEVQAPRGGASQYGVARLWIEKKNGALLRVEGYDMKGRLVRNFEVVSAQKLDGQWMLKQMRIETFNPETKKTTGRTNLEVLGKSP